MGTEREAGPPQAPGPAASALGLWCSLRQARLTGQCPGPVTAQSKHVGRECHLASVSSASSSRNCHVKTPTVTTDWKHVQKTGARRCRWFSLCTVSRPRPQMLGGAPASARLSLERRSSFSKPQNKVLGWNVPFQFQANLSREDLETHDVPSSAAAGRPRRGAWRPRRQPHDLRQPLRDPGMGCAASRVDAQNTQGLGPGTGTGLLCIRPPQPLH